jgi:ABC-2 type transport system ATP-binding protein
LFVSLAGIKVHADRFYKLIEFVGLKGRENDKVSSYSLGMKQRLAIAISLAHDPEILILDEPTNGLDPMGIVDMRKLLTTLSREHGKTILISSHLLSEIEQIATNVLVIHKGRKVAEGPMSSIIKPDESIIDISINGEFDVDNIKNSNWGEFLQNCDGNKIHFKMNTNKIPKLNKWLVEHDYQVLNVNSNRSLENYFLSSTND